MQMYRLALLQPIPHLCLTKTSSVCRVKISDCDFVSESKDGFIPISVKPVDDRLNLVM
jgi:hypothetical protein